MATTEKISVALGRDELRLAKTAAQQDGVSLSAFVTGAVRAWIKERRRLKAAQQVLARFGPKDRPLPRGAARVTRAVGLAAHGVESKEPPAPAAMTWASRSIPVH